MKLERRRSSLKVACLQTRHEATFEECLGGAEAMAKRAKAGGAELVLLPEYFFLPLTGRRSRPDLDEFGPVARFLRSLSTSLGIGVAGNAIVRRGRGYRNVGYLFDRGRLLLSQPKLRPMPRELSWGVRPGQGVRIGRFRRVPISMVVCADILFPEISRRAAERGARILLNPVMSPNLRPDPTRQARESLYVARAYDSAAFVLKAAGVGSRRGRLVIAGRSLIAAPWGLVARYADERKTDVLVAELDLQALESVRSDHPAGRAGAKL